MVLVAPLAGPLAGDGRIHVEDDREVRLESLRRPARQRGDLLVAQVPARGLVGPRGVDVPVRDDDPVALDDGPDERGDVVRAVRCEHERLGPVGDTVAVQDDGPQLRARLRAAGLAGRDDLPRTAVAQCVRQQVDLRALAGAVAALDRDEEAAVDVRPARGRSPLRVCRATQRCQAETVALASRLTVERGDRCGRIPIVLGGAVLCRALLRHVTHCRVLHCRSILPRCLVPPRLLSRALLVSGWPIPVLVRLRGVAGPGRHPECVDDVDAQTADPGGTEREEGDDAAGHCDQADEDVREVCGVDGPRRVRAERHLRRDTQGRHHDGTAHAGECADPAGEGVALGAHAQAHEERDAAGEHRPPGQFRQQTSRDREDARGDEREGREAGAGHARGEVRAGLEAHGPAQKHRADDERHPALSEAQIRDGRLGQHSHGPQGGEQQVARPRGCDGGGGAGQTCAIEDVRTRVRQLDRVPRLRPHEQQHTHQHDECAQERQPRHDGVAGAHAAQQLRRVAGHEREDGGDARTAPRLHAAVAHEAQHGREHGAHGQPHDDRQQRGDHEQRDDGQHHQRARCRERDLDRSAAGQALGRDEQARDPRRCDGCVEEDSGARGEVIGLRQHLDAAQCRGIDERGDPERAHRTEAQRRGGEDAEPGAHLDREDPQRVGIRCRRTGCPGGGARVRCGRRGGVRSRVISHVCKGTRDP